MIYTSEHHELMASIRRFISAEIDPFVDEWEAAETFPCLLYTSPSPRGCS